MVRERTGDLIVLGRSEFLRERSRSDDNESIGSCTTLQWALDAADGQQHIHDRRIFQANLSFHNLIFDRSCQVKLMGFAGCGIDEEPALVCYEWCSYKPDTATNIKTDIFSFRTTLFEIESAMYHFILSGGRST